MERAIIAISESGRVNILSGNIRMSEMDLMELFGVTAPTLRANIKVIYKSGTLCPATTQRCDMAMPKSWATFATALKWSLHLRFLEYTYEASRIRQKVLEGICLRKEKGIGLLISLGCEAPKNRVLS